MWQRRPQEGGVALASLRLKHQKVRALDHSPLLGIAYCHAVISGRRRRRELCAERTAIIRDGLVFERRSIDEQLELALAMKSVPESVSCSFASMVAMPLNADPDT